jgi:uncharacterized protein (TIGR01777 family)
MNIIVSGGSGFIGTFLIPELISTGHVVSTYSRTPDAEKRAGVKAYRWNPVDGHPCPESLENVDVVIHLAGEGVAHKWTDEVKKKIRDSRVLGTRNLVQAMSQMSQRPKALICSSATGYYGDRGEEELVETSAPGRSFLSEVCREWEQEADRALDLDIRVARIRTGMVLGPRGGALARLITAFKTKMGGKLGSGKQWMSWIHVADLVGLYRYAAEHDVAGAFNGTAPNPVRNETFTDALGHALEEPTKVTVPEFALKMLFGEMAEVMLSSQRAFPEAAERAGFEFRFPEITSALQDAVRGG